MKKLGFAIISMLTFGIITTVAKNPLPSNDIREINRGIQGSGIVNKSFVPPAPGKYSKNRYKRDGETVADDGLQLFQVSYQEAVPTNARTAVEYALGLWEDHINSPVPIEVYVRWNSDDKGSALASAGPSNYFRVEGNPLLPENLAPIAIANRKYRMDLSPGRDISVTINKNDEFYYGTDGNCPEDKYDLVTIILHEIGHGLGFVSSADRNEDSKTFSLGSSNYTGELAWGGTIGLSFDYFLESGLGKNLMDPNHFENPSKNLYTAFTNNSLFFNSPLARIANNGSNPKMYAPMIWDDGSSISHLDEGTYQAGNIDALMTPKAGLGEANHNPGPIALAILGDMGWDHVWISHTPTKDREELTQPIRISAWVESDSPTQGNPILMHREPALATPGVEQAFTSSPMIFDAQSELYYHDIQIEGIEKNIEYFIQVNGSADRTFYAPSVGPAGPLTVTVGPDHKAPTVTHTQNSTYILSNTPTITLPYVADDNIALSSLITEIWFDGIPIEPFTFIPPSGETQFYTQIPVIDITPYETMEYRFTAIDASAQQNQAHAPTLGRYSMAIEKIYPASTSYSNDFNSGATDFILEGFDVTTPEGFSSGTLGTKHPYDNNGIGEINVYAYLRQQILIQAGTTISFKEIVLVEPGTEGVEFNNEGFYDYVVVEGSKDQGLTWTPITNGWDSATHPEWLTTFKSKINEEESSTAVGDPSLYKDRTIRFSQSEEFAIGDTVMIRFRLLSDPAAIGWGWTIDDLNIGVQ